MAHLEDQDLIYLAEAALIASPEVPAADVAATRSANALGAVSLSVRVPGHPALSGSVEGILRQLLAREEATHAAAEEARAKRLAPFRGLLERLAAPAETGPALTAAPPPAA